MGSIQEEKYMQRALHLAAQGRGRTSPNPMVGAVIIKDGKIVGEGYHHKAGTPHAEIHALQQAGSLAGGAEIIVNLEPCSHYGRTPPCAEALIKAGVKRVVMAMLDPNPRVAGRGLKLLEQAGIETAIGVLEDEAARLNEVFVKYIKTGLPFITLKTAMTIDGKIASANGDSRWISGEESRRQVHELRNINDAIMVGIGTVLADDPLLNTRLDRDGTRDPVRVIIDGRLDLPVGSKIVSSSREQRTIVFTSRINDNARARTLESYGVQIYELDGTPDILPVEKALHILGGMEICSILLEGGSELNAYMLGKRLVDKIYWFIAPKIVGGIRAPSPVAGQGIELMKDAIWLKSIDVKKIEDDILVIAYTGW